MSSEMPKLEKMKCCEQQNTIYTSYVMSNCQNMAYVMPKLLTVENEKLKQQNI